MSDRYYSAEPICSDRVTLSGSEGHHLARVMRAEVGSEVILFDGLGGEFRARVEQVKRDEVRLAVVERRACETQPPLSLTLAVALPKGERQRWLVEKAVELGVARLVPLTTQRSVSQPVENALERLRRAVVEACKQCGRNRLMEIAAPQSLSELLQQPADGAVRWIAHPQPSTGPMPPVPLPAVVQAAIGPEGGFTDDELELARQHGWIQISLGAHILRVETAAIALAANLLLLTAQVIDPTDHREDGNANVPVISLAQTPRRQE